MSFHINACRCGARGLRLQNHKLPEATAAVVPSSLSSRWLVTIDECGLLLPCKELSNMEAIRFGGHKPKSLVWLNQSKCFVQIASLTD